MLGSELIADILKRIVPFHLESHIGYIRSGYIPDELTRIADVIAEITHPNTVTAIGVRPDFVQDVWCASCTGRYSASQAQALTSQSIAPDPVSLTMGEALSIESGKRRLVENRSTPFTMSMIGTAVYGSMLENRAASHRFAIVVGDELSDFCLAYCLRRIGHPAAWLPQAWIEGLTSHESQKFHRVIASLFFDGPGTMLPGEVRICSASSDTHLLEQRITPLRTALTLTGPVDDAEGIVRSIKEPATVYCEGSPNHLEVLTFSDGNSAGPITSPFPNGLKNVYADTHRWVSEVKMLSTPIPALPGIAETLLGLPDGATAKSVRPSRGMLAYACPGDGFVVGSDLAANLPKPTITLFDLLSAVKLIAASKGFACQLSDKGIYHRDSTEKYKQNSLLAQALRSADKKSILEKFLDHTPSGKGVFNKGVVAGGRRYLDLTATTELMGGDHESAVAFLDELVALRVAYRGFVLGCSSCKNVDWYGLAEMSDEFRCRRCSRAQILSLKNWRNPSSPQVFYKLDEIVYLFLKNDGAVVALAIDHMRRKSRQPFVHVPELEFVKHHHQLESDLCAVWDGALVIGEAKKGPDLAETTGASEKIVGKYARLAELLHARRVVFATAAESWKPGMVESVKKIFNGRLAQPVLLTRSDLYD